MASAAENEAVIAVCIAGGATSTQYNTALMELAIIQGATASDLPTALFQMFTGMGYVGSLQDMWKQWAAAGMPAAPAADYDGTVDITDLGSGFIGANTEGAFTPSDSCGLPLLLTARYNSLLTFGGTTVRLATSGNEALYASVDVTFPAYSSTAITCSLNGTRWEGSNAGLVSWMATQVGNTIDMEVIGTPA